MSATKTKTRIHRTKPRKNKGKHMLLQDKPVTRVSEATREVGQDKNGRPIRVGDVIRNDSDSVGVVTAIQGDALIHRLISKVDSCVSGGFDADIAYNCRVEQSAAIPPEGSIQPTARGPVDVVVRMMRTLSDFESLYCILAGDQEEVGTTIPENSLDDHPLSKIMILQREIKANLDDLLQSSIYVEKYGGNDCSESPPLNFPPPLTPGQRRVVTAVTQRMLEVLLSIRGELCHFEHRDQCSFDHLIGTAILGIDMAVGAMQDIIKEAAMIRDRNYRLQQNP